jgi:CheY-like chemotaxis protein
MPRSSEDAWPSLRERPTGLAASEDGVRSPLAAALLAGTLESSREEEPDLMESAAVLRRPRRDEQPGVQLLLADDDAHLRSLVAGRACDIVEPLVVLEAGDGAEAIQIGLQSAPQLALLDVNMPRLGGIEVAMTLRELRPQMRLALQSADPLAHRERARECQLPLFDKRELDRVFGWLELQAQPFVEPRALAAERSLVCADCGYGVACAVPPDRCPMCQREGRWIHSPWRPLTTGGGFA